MRWSQQRAHNGSRASSPQRAPSWKRALDIACILAAVPAWVPLGLLIALAIKLVSRGPIFFKQERIGFLGRPFFCWKFRTMVPDAKPSLHESHLDHLMSSNCAMTKLDSQGDPRLIPGGLWLRSLGWDELPQIINVLRGEMSLVGPRPCMAYEYARYQPRHRQRCETLPGLTGLWQINGKNRTTFEEMIDLDLRYVATKSLLLDLKIIFLTVPAIILQVCDLRRRRKPAQKVRAASTLAPPTDFNTPKNTSQKHLETAKRGP
ncbi:Sugar transferase [Verrucomicrobia bacterium]|nr:Sugar transferase [Verrucomicrobiota bacterium]